jgi:hypothetical protein
MENLHVTLQPLPLRVLGSSYVFFIYKGIRFRGFRDCLWSDMENHHVSMSHRALRYSVPVWPECSASRSRSSTCPAVLSASIASSKYPRSLESSEVRSFE